MCLSVQFSCSGMSKFLWPHGLQHTRPPCPSPIPEACSNSCPSSWWCHQSSHPLSSPSPPAFYLSQHYGLFQWVSSSIRWPKYWSFSFSISPSNEYSGLISFTKLTGLISLQSKELSRVLRVQHHSSKASILRHSAFFMLQLSHPYMTTGKTIALIRWTFIGKVMSLLFNILSRFVIAFLPRSKVF